jgi:hypothetical protein
MNRDTFTYLLDHAQTISDKQLMELRELINRYPYLQSARALELKALKARDSHRYNEALKKTAVHTTDRHILFEYITSPNFRQDAVSQKIKQHDESVYQIEVIHQDVGEELSREIDRQLKAEIRKAEAILNPALFEKKEAKPSADERIEKTLKPDKPLDFSPDDRHSFTEWLKLSKVKPIEREEEGTTREGKSKKAGAKDRKFELIDRFIEERPKIRPIQNSGNQVNLAEPFSQPPDRVMTETLARVYVAQKNYQKALQAYKILSLKYPEKSGFFADQIRAINKLINK